jgi:hypothetical protein
METHLAENEWTEDISCMSMFNVIFFTRYRSRMVTSCLCHSPFDIFEDGAMMFFDFF